ncbi:MAG: M48 family metallopeptidase [Leptospiraceae bacterium]|nr:M48 family metallopeptidase [Leptospiraceae bacterium]
MNSKTIQFDQIGEIQITKTHRSRRMSLKIHPIYGICLSIPSYWSYKEAERILIDNRDWLEKSIKKLSVLERKSTPFTENSIIKMKYHKVKLKPWTGKDVSYTLKDDLLTIYYPESKDILDKEIQNEIRFRIEETYRIEAKKYLPERVAILAEENNFKYKSITIKNMKSRWGSCSVTNQINLSLHLLRIPEELSDYVILHELCHTVHKNHSKDFWNLLCRVCDNAIKKDKEMRNFDALRY